MKPITVTCLNAEGSSGLLKKGEQYLVACSVSEGIDYSGATVKDAYILFPNKDHQFPYCWDMSRFETIDWRIK